MEAVVYCPKCEAENHEDAATCGHCGHLLRLIDPSHEDVESQQPTKRNLFAEQAEIRDEAGYRDAKRRRRTFRERWNTPLSQMTMRDVLGCQIDVTIFVIIFGIVVGLLIAIFDAVRTISRYG